MHAHARTRTHAHAHNPWPGGGITRLSLSQPRHRHPILSPSSTAAVRGHAHGKADVPGEHVPQAMIGGLSVTWRSAESRTGDLIPTRRRVVGAVQLVGVARRIMRSLAAEPPAVKAVPLQSGRSVQEQAKTAERSGAAAAAAAATARAARNVLAVVSPRSNMDYGYESDSRGLWKHYPARFLLVMRGSAGLPAAGYYMRASPTGRRSSHPSPRPSPPWGGQIVARQLSSALPFQRRSSRR